MARSGRAISIVPDGRVREVTDRAAEAAAVAAGSEAADDGNETNSQPPNCQFQGLVVGRQRIQSFSCVPFRLERIFRALTNPEPMYKNGLG